MSSSGELRLSHLDESGRARMVDVGDKPITARTAVAGGRVVLSAVAWPLLSANHNAKGEVLGTARIAAIQAAKQCANLIPLCHSLPLSFVGVDFVLHEAERAVEIIATCRSDFRTGVEMEAMTACSVAALTIYDMCKAADKGIVIEAIQLHYKSGGKSGEWRREPGCAVAEGTSAPAAAPQAQGAAVVPPVVAAAAGAAAVDAPAPAAKATPASTDAAAPSKITLVYFARIAELAGCRSEPWPLSAPRSAGELLAAVRARHPALAEAGRVQLAINQRHAATSALVQPGDEVAVFEPVTGG